jgi:uncharacterized membrane protein YGL010W
MSNMNDTSKLNKFQQLYFDFTKYHNKIGTILTHIIFIPIIALSLDKLLENFASNTLKLPFNPSLVIYLLIGIFFIYMDLVSGVLTTAQYICLSLLTKPTDFAVFGQPHTRVLLVIFGVSYAIAQLGHKLIEGRSATKEEDSWIFLISPLVSNIQLLNMTLGYRKEEVNEAQKYVDYNIKQFLEEKTKTE